MSARDERPSYERALQRAIDHRDLAREANNYISSDTGAIVNALLAIEAQLDYLTHVVAAVEDAIDAVARVIPRSAPDSVKRPGHSGDSGRSTKTTTGADGRRGTE